jgi:hypothetical protein
VPVEVGMQAVDEDHRRHLARVLAGEELRVEAPK